MVSLLQNQFGNLRNKGKELLRRLLAQIKFVVVWVKRGWDFFYKYVPTGISVRNYTILKSEVNFFNDWYSFIESFVIFEK